MSYSKTNPIMNDVKLKEIELLNLGYSYIEISKITGSLKNTISERNRNIYNIDIIEKFKLRIERNGIPNRYKSDDGFGYWFSGYFDGEGCLNVFYRDRDAKYKDTVYSYCEKRVSIRLACRYDDKDVLDYIKTELNSGKCYTHGKRGNTNKSYSLSIEKIEDLAEIIIPIFDKYKLKTKKKEEYKIWREMVMIKYIQTMGGNSTITRNDEINDKAFLDSVEKIKKIRHKTIE